MNKFLVMQLMRFGIIGSLAAFINFGIVILLVELWGWHPLSANAIAFLIAFQVSYSGHRYWTFRILKPQHRFRLLSFEKRHLSLFHRVCWVVEV